jgi:hypothetical protein
MTSGLTYRTVDEDMKQLLQNIQPTEISTLPLFFLHPGNLPNPRLHFEFISGPRPVILQIVFVFHDSPSPNAIPGRFEAVPGIGLHNRKSEEK